jgi:hypothetical protein
MMRTLARRTKAWWARSRTPWAGVSGVWSIGSITSTAERQALLEPRHLRNGLHWDDGGSHSIFLPPQRPDLYQI